MPIVAPEVSLKLPLEEAKTSFRKLLKSKTLRCFTEPDKIWWNGFIDAGMDQLYGTTWVPGAPFNVQDLLSKRRQFTPPPAVVPALTDVIAAQATNQLLNSDNIVILLTFHGLYI